MNRGAGRQNIFMSSQQYEKFLELLLQIHRRYRVEIHSYCLMPNHYHLLLKTPVANLSKAMKHLNGIYAKNFNVSNNRDRPYKRQTFCFVIQR